MVMSSTAPNNREKEIFEQALEIESDAERLAFVRKACGEDAALCARVQVLLKSYETCGWQKLCLRRMDSRGAGSPVLSRDIMFLVCH
jgi:hypothetical protein